MPDDVALTPGRVIHLDPELTLPLERRTGDADEPDPEPAPADARADAPVVATDAPVPAGQLTRLELLRKAHLGDHALEELESFGLITHVGGSGDAARYDEEALEIAQRRVDLLRHAGSRARHLRMYQHFADREAELFIQALILYRRQRNPAARARRSRASSGELVRPAPASGP